MLNAIEKELIRTKDKLKTHTFNYYSMIEKLEFAELESFFKKYLQNEFNKRNKDLNGRIEEIYLFITASKIYFRGIANILDKKYLVNEIGNLISNEYKKICPVAKAEDDRMIASSDFFVFNESNEQGVINVEGKEIIKANYKSIKPFYFEKIDCEKTYLKHKKIQDVGIFIAEKNSKLKRCDVYDVNRDLICEEAYEIEKCRESNYYEIDKAFNKYKLTTVESIWVIRAYSDYSGEYDSDYYRLELSLRTLQTGGTTLSYVANPFMDSNVCSYENVFMIDSEQASKYYLKFFYLYRDFIQNIMGNIKKNNEKELYSGLLYTAVELDEDIRNLRLTRLIRIRFYQKKIRKIYELLQCIHDGDVDEILTNDMKSEVLELLDWYNLGARSEWGEIWEMNMIS